jgi:hypothetical protein
VACAIQKGLNSLGHCDMVKIKEVNPRDLNQYDLIGLAPRNRSAGNRYRAAQSQAFINDMRFVGGKQAFVFCTHGTHYEMFFPE